jgi:DNA-binding transcriptional MerR regulator
MEAISRNSSPSRWLGPGELARRLGISIKALRVYERAGLVVPGRREGGWRTYGPKDIARLHELLALRSLGLSLAEAKQVLDAPASSLERTLNIQQRHLAAQVTLMQRRLAAVNAARRRLQEEGSLGVDDLLSLSSETAVTAPISADQVEAIIHGHAEDHKANADLAGFEQDLRARLARARIRPADFERQMSLLVADASFAAEAADVKSDRARHLAARWLDLVAPLGPRDKFGEGVAEFAAVLIRDPDLAAALDFLKRAVAAHAPASNKP